MCLLNRYAKVFLFYRSHFALERAKLYCFEMAKNFQLQLIARHGHLAFLFSRLPHVMASCMQSVDSDTKLFRRIVFIRNVCRMHKYMYWQHIGVYRDIYQLQPESALEGPV